MNIQIRFIIVTLILSTVFAGLLLIQSNIKNLLEETAMREHELWSSGFSEEFSRIYSKYQSEYKQGALYLENINDSSEIVIDSFRGETFEFAAFITDNAIEYEKKYKEFTQSEKDEEIIHTLNQNTRMVAFIKTPQISTYMDGFSCIVFKKFKKSAIAVKYSIVPFFETEQKRFFIFNHISKSLLVRDDVEIIGLSDVLKVFFSGQTSIRVWQEKKEYVTDFFKLDPLRSIVIQQPAENIYSRGVQTVKIIQGMFWVSGILFLFFLYEMYDIFKINRKLYAAHIELKKNYEMKTNFLSLVSHDLKTPVARIDGLARIIETRGDNSVSDMCMRIRNNCIDMTEFIQNILCVSRIDSRKMMLHITGSNLAQVMKKVILKHQYKISEKKLTVHTEIEDEIPAECDEKLIQQVLSNLLVNACVHGIKESTVSISAFTQKEKAVLVIANSCDTISEETIKNLFQKFVKLKDDSPGTGIGLYLCKYIIEMHSGTIQSEFIPGNPGIFKLIVVLPQKYEDNRD